MGAAELLDRLRGDGLVFTLLEDDKLHVAPRALLNEETRADIRAERDALVQALKVEAKPARRSSNPLMTVEQGDACHTPCWDDTEIASFTTRVLLFVRRGIDATDAEDLAERLTLRDRDVDDRRLCLECSWLSDRGRCIAAANGRIPGAYRRLEPAPAILQRCEAYEPWRT